MTDSVPNTEELDPPEDGSSDPDIEAKAREAEEPPEGEEALETEAGASEQPPAELAEEREGSIEPELAALREENERLNDRHLRLAAEFNNYRRRVEAERLDLWARAQADIVGRFLEVLDDLQRVAALDLSNATVEAIMEGIDLVDRKFMRVLSESGAEVIDPEGEPFDPERMEAVMRAAADNEEDEDRVAQVFLKGYALKGELVRPARVSVYKFG
jgi:molecular chaperone GrpE